MDLADYFKGSGQHAQLIDGSMLTDEYFTHSEDVDSFLANPGLDFDGRSMLDDLLFSTESIMPASIQPSPTTPALQMPQLHLKHNHVTKIEPPTINSDFRFETSSNDNSTRKKPRKTRTSSSSNTSTVRAVPTSPTSPSELSSSGSSATSPNAQAVPSPDFTPSLLSLPQASIVLPAGATPMTIAGWPTLFTAQLVLPPGITPSDASAASASAAWFSQGKVAITRLPPTQHVEIPAPPKEVKKSAHNVIERRYRNNINEKINELKSVIPDLNQPDSNEKLNKGKILRRAIDYVRFLCRTNESVTNQNKAMREIIRGMGGEALLTKLDEQLPSPVVEYDEGSTGDDQVADVPNSAEEENASPDDTVVPSARNNRRERSESISMPANPPKAMRLSESGRIALVVCMGLCLVSSPWALFGNGEGASELSSGRSLLSLIDAQDAWGFNSVIASAFWIGVRLIMAICCLVAVFLGDQVSAENSTEFVKAANKLELAEEALEKGLVGRGRQHLEEAFRLVGQSVPVSPFDLTTSLLWQIVRQISHVLLIGFWLDRLVANRTTQARKAFGLSARIANALQRTQLVATNDPTGGPWFSLNVALNAVNLSQAYGMEPALMARVYAIMALQLHVLLPARLRFIARYYLSLARHELITVAAVVTPPSSPKQHPRQPGGSNDDISTLCWLRYHDGYAFFTNGSWVNNLRHIPTHALTPPEGGGAYDPLNRFGALYREHLLLHAQMSLLKHEPASICLPRLESLYRQAVAAGDLAMQWWTLISRATLMTRMDKQEDADGLIARADKLMKDHAFLQQEPARKATLYASFARACVQNNASLELSMRAAEKAASLLREASSQLLNNVEPSSSSSSSSSLVEPTLTRALLSTVAIQVLEVRLAVAVAIKSSAALEAHSKKLLTSARRDLSNLQAIGTFSALTPTRYRFQAILRALAGGSCDRTAVLFEKALSLARASNLIHEEGMILQSMAWCCSNTPEEAQKRLLSALYCYEKVESLHDVRVAKSLMFN